MIIKSGMTIQVRTKEELEIVLDVCNKEGHKRTNRANRYLTIEALKQHRIPCSISVGAFEDKFPNDISVSAVGYTYPGAKYSVEASQLFRNQLISKRRNLH